MASDIKQVPTSATNERSQVGITSPLGVCVFKKPAPNRAQPINYPDYVFEILQHAGVCHEPIDQNDLLAKLDHLKLLLTVGDQELDEPTRQKLAAWVKAGGAWLSVGGTCGLTDVLGVENAPSTYANWGPGAVLHGEGYLTGKDASHPAMGHLKNPLHFFGGIALRSCGAKVIAGSLDAHQRSAGPDVLFETSYGQGRAMTLSIDVTGTIVRIQQGIAVTRDGVPAPDGTAPVADGVLKSGDGGALDWIFDRQPVAGVPGLSLFLDPIADLWREVILRSIFHLARTQNVALPVLWLYPRALPAIAHMSHDSDGNESARARELLGLLERGKINSTWCIITPGYDQKLMTEIRSAGHEFATHYDAMTGTPGLTWGEAQFDQQHRELSQLFGEKPVTNKNHYLRWEGDVEFFDWCEKRGIELDQSKGPSKTGEAGFNFGTCHPYLPVAFDNRYINVLELATLTQDLVIFAPAVILDSLIAGSLRVHGVLHLLFHPAHIGKPNVNEAVLHSIESAKNAGMEWWTSARINHWERARRKVRWSNYTSASGKASITLETIDALEDATLLWLNAGSATVNGQGTKQGKITAWGFEFTSSTVTLDADKMHQLEITVGS